MTDSVDPAPTHSANEYNSQLGRQLPTTDDIISRVGRGVASLPQPHTIAPVPPHSSLEHSFVIKERWPSRRMDPPTAAWFAKTKKEKWITALWQSFLYYFFKMGNPQHTGTTWIWTSLDFAPVAVGFAKKKRSRPSRDWRRPASFLRRRRRKRLWPDANDAIDRLLLAHKTPPISFASDDRITSAVLLFTESVCEQKWIEQTTRSQK